MNERPPPMDDENTEEEYPSKDNIPNSGVETATKKSSKAKIVRRESSRLQNFLLKKIKFNNNGNCILLDFLRFITFHGYGYL